ncbi:hypothetical protein [Actinomadura sp. 7K507]|uniref:hypothetical protein n=1 Tax=Actinomadura sp. 7K507 TaxID=2530365 RepID=UPI00104DD3CE|nr:hypothetical protein [Actinomadura sp. 7K507]TDC76745.1 hypothetical protein E1285_39630 [Actinomadura sp. 7K507]
MIPRGQRYVLSWRTRRRPDTAVRYLEALVSALEAEGWRFVRLYRAEEFPIPVPLLWVYVRDVGIAVSVLAVPGGSWAYYEAQRGRSASWRSAATRERRPS